MSDIHLIIDRLILRGLDAADRHAFVSSLRSELVRTLANPASPISEVQSHHTPSLRLPQATLISGPAGPRRLAAHVAQGIARGLKP